MKPYSNLGDTLGSVWPPIVQFTLLVSSYPVAEV
jgi:hypothetical protein